MTTQRAWLTLGLVGLLMSAVSRVGAAGPGQVEVEGYGGSSAGQWACGPTARARYGGVGGHARVYVEPQAHVDEDDDEREPRVLTPDPVLPDDLAPALTARHEEREREREAANDLEPHGASIGGGGGAEYRSFTRLACNDATCGANDVVPGARLLAAGRGNFGYDWDYLGFRVGALLFQRWVNNTDASPTSYVLPDAEFRVGRRAGFHGSLGFGAYDLPTISRPGAYLAIGYASGGWAAEVRGGAHLVFDAQVGFRGELSVRNSITRGIAPGVGLAVSTAEQITPEGRVFVVFTP